MKIKFKSKKIKNKFIYGELFEHADSRLLIILLSGFSGGMNSSLFGEATNFFLKKNYNLLKLNFCNDMDTKHKKALKLEEIDLSVYQLELKNIVDSLSVNYSKIVLIGHSFGAVISILFLSKYPKYKKTVELILWEPALLPWKKSWMEEDFVFIEKDNLYEEKYSNLMINRKFYNQCIRCENTAKKLEVINKNTLIVGATSMGIKNARRYYSKTKRNKTKLIIINETDHNFSKKKNRKILFDNTLSFLNENT